LRGTTFEVPEDFDARDWQKLPFQLGPAVCEASFAVPARRIREFSQVSQGKGTIRLPDGEATAPATWLVEVSSVEDAASWAIAEDVTPLSPPELVAAWREKLGGVISHG
jgi:proteasome accessory factor B